MAKETITIPMRIRWTINNILMRHTPKRILKKFAEGKYQDNLTKDEPRPKGHMRWKRVERLINRCLDCGFYLKSHQELNIDPLGQSFLEAYEITKSYKLSQLWR